MSQSVLTTLAHGVHPELHNNFGVMLLKLNNSIFADALWTKCMRSVRRIHSGN